MANVYKLTPLDSQMEGGLDDPADLVGATNMVVTPFGTWKSCGYDKDGDGDIDVDDLRLLTREDVVNRVLKPHYWEMKEIESRASRKYPCRLCEHWCTRINIPQRLLGVTVDGIGRS